MIPVGWTWPVVVLGAASFFAIGMWRGALDGASVALWCAAGALAAFLCQATLVPPGVDGAMHTALARVLADSNGHPASFRPLWPVDSFGSYPIGQPTLTALIATLGHLGWREAGLIGHALCYALVMIGFAASVSRWGGGSALGLAVGVGAVLSARSPLYFWTWGGAPSALGIAFAVAAFAAGVDAVRLGRLREAAACSILSAAALMTHPVSVVALCWAALPLLAAVLIAYPELRRRVLHLAIAAGGVLLLCAPFLATVRHVPAEGVAWTRTFLREAGRLPTIPRMLHDVPLVAGAVAAVVVLARRRRRAAVPLAVAFVLVLLVLNGRAAILPGSFLLYPDRVAVLLLLPIAMLVQDALDGWPRLGAIAALGVLAHAAVLHSNTLREARAHALVTIPDLRVFSSVVLPSSCWVINNYGDAGQWIPALLAQPITLPQVNVTFFDLSAEVHPCAAFRGDKRAYSVDTVPCPGPRCMRIARDSGAEMFRIVDPSLTVRVLAPR